MSHGIAKGFFDVNIQDAEYHDWIHNYIDTACSIIRKDTLEESPMAYKRAPDVLDYIDETVEVEQRLRPVYNFKAF